MLKTETPSLVHTNLDQYPVADLVNVLIEDQLNAVTAVRFAFYFVQIVCFLSLMVIVIRFAGAPA